MPTQEDRVTARIRQVSAMIRDSKRINSEKLDSWALVSLGIRDRTTRMYVKALMDMGMVRYDADKREYCWEGGE